MMPDSTRAEKEAWMRGRQAREEYRDAVQKIERPEPPRPYGVRHPNSIIVWLAREFEAAQESRKES